MVWDKGVSESSRSQNPPNYSRQAKTVFQNVAKLESICLSSKGGRLVIAESKKPGRSFAMASMDEYPARKRRPIPKCEEAVTRGSFRRLDIGYLVLETGGTALARSRHRGTNHFHPVDIDA